MTRTQDEIVQRARERQKEDLFGFEISEYVRFLDFDHAKEFLKGDVTPDDWSQDSQDNVRNLMIEYMDFAWDKANSGRGISAWRSLAHYVAWLWIEGTDEAVALSEELATFDYTDYGKPQLRKICRHLGLNPDDYDDGRRGNTEGAMFASDPLPVGERE